MISALLLFNQLKGVRRTGWLRHGLQEVETVAAHSWGTALWTLMLLPAGLNRERALSYAIIHDLAEVVVGDITPHCGVSREEKARREHEAMRSICADHPSLLELWRSYEAQADPEAHFVKQLDRLDMALQAHATSDELKGAQAEFYASAAKGIEDPTLMALLNSLKDD